MLKNAVVAKWCCSSSWRCRGREASTSISTIYFPHLRPHTAVLPLSSSQQQQPCWTAETLRKWYCWYHCLCYPKHSNVAAVLAPVPGLVRTEKLKKTRVLVVVPQQHLTTGRSEPFLLSKLLNSILLVFVGVHTVPCCCSLAGVRNKD